MTDREPIDIQDLCNQLVLAHYELGAAFRSFAALVCGWMTNPQPFEASALITEIEAAARRAADQRLALDPSATPEPNAHLMALASALRPIAEGNFNPLRAIDGGKRDDGDGPEAA